MKTMVIAAVLILAAGFAGPLAASAYAEELDGRTVAEKGTRGSLSGILVYEKSEWYLKSGETLYELHLGRFGHDGVTTSTMKEGNKAEVDGFILDTNISPISIVSEGRNYQFRSEDGAPLWAGQGERRYAETTLPPGRGLNSYPSPAGN